MTAIPSDSAAQNGYANQMAAFLLDVPQEIEARHPRGDRCGTLDGRAHRGGRHKSYWTYVHDKWQIHPSITLDLGLRHEYYTPLVGFHGKGGMVNYDPETNQLLVAGYGNIPEISASRATGRTSPRARASPGASLTRPSCARAMA